MGEFMCEVCVCDDVVLLMVDDCVYCEGGCVMMGVLLMNGMLLCGCDVRKMMWWLDGKENDVCG